MRFRLSTKAQKVALSVLGIALLLEGATFASTFFEKAYVITYDSGSDVTISGPNSNGTCTYTRPSDRCDTGGLALIFGEGCWETPNSHHLTWTRTAFAGRPCGSAPHYVGTPIGAHAEGATGTPIGGGN